MASANVGKKSVKSASRSLTRGAMRSPQHTISGTEVPTPRGSPLPPRRSVPSAICETIRVEVPLSDVKMKIVLSHCPFSLSRRTMRPTFLSR